MATNNFSSEEWGPKLVKRLITIAKELGFTGTNSPKLTDRTKKQYYHLKYNKIPLFVIENHNESVSKEGMITTCPGSQYKKQNFQTFLGDYMNWNDVFKTDRKKYDPRGKTDAEIKDIFERIIKYYELQNIIKEKNILKEQNKDKDNEKISLERKLREKIQEVETLKQRVNELERNLDDVNEKAKQDIGNELFDKLKLWLNYKDRNLDGSNHSS